MEKIKNLERGLGNGRPSGWGEVDSKVAGKDFTNKVTLDLRYKEVRRKLLVNPEEES